MANSHMKFRLSWVESYYPMVYQDEHTNKVKGSSVEFFKHLREYLKDISYEYQHYDKYREPNRTLHSLGGAMGDIVDGKVLTELSAASLDETSLQVFDASPPIGGGALAFYEADIGTETWSPLSFFIPFPPLMCALIVVTIVISCFLPFRSRKPLVFSSILTTVSSACILFGATILLFAYNAGYQGTMIAADPVEKVTYEEILASFASGQKLWYFRTIGYLDFSSIPSIPIHQEDDVPKLIKILCENPKKAMVALYEVEFLQLQLFDAPKGCRIQRVNLIAPIKPSPTYVYFQTSFYYFLLPKNLPRRLRKAIDFTANLVFQADQLIGILIFALELVAHRLKIENRIGNYFLPKSLQRSTNFAARTT